MGDAKLMDEALNTWHEVGKMLCAMLTKLKAKSQERAA